MRQQVSFALSVAQFWGFTSPVAISPLLELQATPAQKAAKIDLADYWFEASKRGV